MKGVDKELNLVPLTYDFAFKRMLTTERNNDYLFLKIFLVSALRLDIDPNSCENIS